MRTTIDIATPILDELRALRDREGGTLGEIVSGLLAEALRTRRPCDDQPEFEWTSKLMQARVDLGDEEAVHAILDDEPS